METPPSTPSAWSPTPAEDPPPTPSPTPTNAGPEGATVSELPTAAEAANGSRRRRTRLGRGTPSTDPLSSGRSPSSDQPPVPPGLKRPRPKATREQREQMMQVVGGFVSLAGVAFAMAATRRAPDKDWMPTRAEQESIAAPLTSIALRHAPEGELEDAGDLVDGIGVAVATGAYAMRASIGQPGGAVEAGATMQPPTPPPPAPEPPTPTPPGWGG